LVLGAAAVGYAAALLIFSPEFLTAIVPMIRTAYGDYEVSFLEQFARPWVGLWALSVLILWRERRAASSLTAAAVITAFAFCCSYLVQQKGWHYHALPVTGAIFFAAATMLPIRRWAPAQRPMIACLAGIMVSTIMPSVVNGPYENSRAPYVRELLRGSRSGMSVVMLTGHPSNIWPMVEEHGLKWPSRHFAFWMVHSIFAHQNEHGALSTQLRDLAESVRSQTVQDLLCHPPDLILVDDFSASKSPGFDIVQFFEESDDFKQLFSNYTKERTAAVYTSYRKRANWRPNPPAYCRTIH
jgi:hypothetical protein